MILHKIRPSPELVIGIINGFIITIFFLLLFLVLSGFRGCHLSQVNWRGDINYGEGEKEDYADWTPRTRSHDSSFWGVHGGIELKFKTETTKPSKKQ